MKGSDCVFKSSGLFEFQIAGGQLHFASQLFDDTNMFIGGISSGFSRR